MAVVAMVRDTPELPNGAVAINVGEADVEKLKAKGWRVRDTKKVETPKEPIEEPKVEKQEEAPQEETPKDDFDLSNETPTETRHRGKR